MAHYSRRTFSGLFWWVVCGGTILMYSLKLLVVLLLISVLTKVAGSDERYKNVPDAVRQWYRDAELTPAAQKRLGHVKCCDKADVVKTQFRVSNVGGQDEWYWLSPKGWKKIPDDVIHWGKAAPSSQPTLFVYSGNETCFFPGIGGG